MDFEWDPNKDSTNQTKHGVSFAEASTIFADEHELTIYDPGHSEGEHRFLSIGRSSSGRVLVVAYSEPEDNQIRIISARPAEPPERRRYESDT